MAKAGLRKVTKTVRTKKGTVKRSYWVKAQGPQPKATLRSADASSGKAASRGRIIGAVLGSALGGTVGALGGAAAGGVMTHGHIMGTIRSHDSWAGAGNSRHTEMYAHLARNRPGMMAGAYAGGAARGAMVFGAGGAASGAVVGALMGHVVGRAIDRRRAKKGVSMKQMNTRYDDGTPFTHGGSEWAMTRPFQRAGSDHSAFATALGVERQTGRNAHSMTNSHWGYHDPRPHGQGMIDSAFGISGVGQSAHSQDRAHDLAAAFKRPVTHVATGRTTKPSSTRNSSSARWG